MTIPQKYRRPILIAVLFHAVLFLALILSFAPHAFRAPSSSAPMQTIQAKAIIEPNAAAQIMQSEVQKKLMEARAQATAKKELMEARMLATAKLKAQVQKKLMEARMQAKAQKKLMKARVTAKAKKELMEARALATAKLKQAQATAKKLQQELMQQQINAEAKNISAVVSQAQQGAIDKYKAAILSAIQSNWRIDQINSKLKCIYSVNLAPDGTVLSVQLMKSSGDSALDQSAQQAITLASPLPVPHNPALFNHFRQLVLTLSPQGILQSVSSA